MSSHVWEESTWPLSVDMWELADLPIPSREHAWGFKWGTARLELPLLRAKYERGTPQGGLSVAERREMVGERLDMS